MPARVVIQDPELVWKGEWNVVITYPSESVVGYEGSSYVTDSATQGDTPTDGPPWSLVAAKGEQGPQGPEGLSGDAAARIPVFIQGVPALVWQVQHDLGYDPAVEVVDSAGTRVITEIAYVTPGSYLEIRNIYQFSGRAILS